MARLSLMFTGLCAFVPNHQLSANRVRVLLVDALRGHVPHYPVLVFPHMSWEPSGREPDGEFIDAAGNRMFFCRLDDQDLRIEGAADNQLRVVGQVEHYDCPSARDQEDFGWLAPMAKINRPANAPNSPVWGGVDERCLSDNNVFPKVISRIYLTDGVLRSHVQAQDDLDNVVKWHFKEHHFGMPIAHIQAITEEVALDFPLGDSEVVGFGGKIGIRGPNPWPLDALFLKPTPDGVVHAWIENMPWEQIVRRKYDEVRVTSRRKRDEVRITSKRTMAGTSRDRDTGKRDPDYHFMHFYDLLGGAKTGRLPFPEERRCPSDGQPSADNPKCPPVQLSAHPRA